MANLQPVPDSPRPPVTQPGDIDAREFEALRPYLFTIAYRLLGTASEAEDVVQEAYLRARTRPAGEVQSLKAYLATVVSRLALDQLRSARATREVYVGPWLPEPVPTADLAPTPVDAVEQYEDITLAFLVLLERLTPEERATYVLREAFGYPYDEIGTILGKSPEAARQLAHRARERVAAGRPRFPAPLQEQRRLAERFLTATRSGNLADLTDLLAADVTSWSDGGAAQRAARRPIRGRDKVARWALAGMQRWLAGTEATFSEINGGIACLFWDGPRLHDVITFEIADGRIHAVRSIVNLEKLAYLQEHLPGPNPSSS